MIVVNLLVALTINATDELMKEGGVRQSKKKVHDIINLLDVQAKIYGTLGRCSLKVDCLTRPFIKMKVNHFHISHNFTFNLLG